MRWRFGRVGALTLRRSITMIESLVAQRLGSLSATSRDALALVLPGGRRIGPDDARVTLRLAGLAPLAHVAAGQVGRLAEDYVEERIDIEGAMRDVVDVAAQLVRDDPTRAAEPPGPLAWWRELTRRSKSRARHRAEVDARQVQFHYDVSDDFYALWLDPRRVYSCAYFRQPMIDAGPGAGGQARPHLQQADAASRRALPGHRRRLGRAAAVGRRASRRDGHRHHAVEQPARPCQPADRAARADGPGRRCACSTTATCPRTKPSTRSRRWACSSMSGAPCCRATSPRSAACSSRAGWC